MIKITKKEEYEDGKLTKREWILGYEKESLVGMNHTDYINFKSLAELEEFKLEIDRILAQDKEGK